MPSRAEIIALAALKKARRRPVRGESGKSGATVVIREVQEAPPRPDVEVRFAPAPEVLHGMDGRGIEDIRVEQKGADLTFIFVMSDGGEIRRKVTLPKAEKGGASGSFYVRSGIARTEDHVRYSDGSTTVEETDDIIIVTDSGTVTLPDAMKTGRPLQIKRFGGAAVTLQPINGQTIDGLSDLVINVNLYSVYLKSDGTNWVVL